MLETVKNIWRIKELRERLLFTLAMFVVFRVGSHVPVPGGSILQSWLIFFLGDDIFGFLNVMSGGALSKFSIFAMGIMPYINASIIMNLLTVVIPQAQGMGEEGPEGRKTCPADPLWNSGDCSDPGFWDVFYHRSPGGC